MATKQTLTLPNRWRHLPNSLTIARGLIGLGLIACGARAEWRLCFWLLLAALASDFLDGLAAKKLHASSRLGVILDPIADCLLSAGGMIGLSLAHKLPYGLIITMGLSAALIGYVKFLQPHQPRLRHVVQSISVIYLFGVWAVLAWMYADLAFGWSWLYPLLTVVLLIGAASLKRHRLRAWYGWLRNSG